MAMSYNTKFLDRLLAAGISEFTKCEAPDYSEQHPQASYWISNYFLNSLLRGTFKNQIRQYAANQIYRADVAFSDYHEAKDLTTKYLRTSRTDNPIIQSYFRALARWESCLLNLQIFIDVMNKMKANLEEDCVFEPNDGTPAQRAYCIANTVKHFGSDIAAGRHAEEDTVPMWLTNIGFKTRSNELSFEELGQLVSDVATVAEKLQDPLSFGKPDA